MPTASLNTFGVGLDIPPTSQIVTRKAIASGNYFHSLCVESRFTDCDTAGMAEDKNGGPNHLKAWREFRRLTQAELAELVDTNPNMIGYLESGERSLSFKWLRRLAPALNTRPGMILDHDPHTLDTDVVAIWVNADDKQRRQIADIAKTIVRDGTTD